MPNPNTNPNSENDPQGQPDLDDSQSPQEDMFGQISNEALPEENDPQDDGHEDQDTEEPDDDSQDTDDDADDDDLDDDLDEPGKPSDSLEGHSSEELRQMYVESQKQIGSLANRVGELTASLQKSVEKPEVPPQHVMLANASPDDIETHLKLPEGVSGVQVKLMANLVNQALSHELKRFEPMLNDFVDFKTDTSIQEELIAKHNDLPVYAPKIKTILSKRYPNGVPVDKRKDEIENIYRRLKKREKAEALAKSKNDKSRQQKKSASGARSATPSQRKSKPTFFDDINDGI